MKITDVISMGVLIFAVGGSWVSLHSSITEIRVNQDNMRNTVLIRKGFYDDIIDSHRSRLNEIEEKIHKLDNEIVKIKDGDG